MTAFGPHLILDCSGCDRAKLQDRTHVYRVLDEMPGRIGMTKISEPEVLEWLDKWATIPGYTGYVVLAESHMSLHTFPDSDYVFIDVFSCREFDIEKAIRFLSEAFGAKRVTTNIIQRGLDFPKPELLTE